jgi:hypothetical protein
MPTPTEEQLHKLRADMAAALIPVFGLQVTYILLVVNNDGFHMMSNASEGEHVKAVITAAAAYVEDGVPVANVDLRTN